MMGEFSVEGSDAAGQPTLSSGLSVILGSRGGRVELELASRAIELVREGGAAAERLLILSPAGRAARRVSARIRESLTDARPISTSFAGLGIMILRDHFRAAGFARAPRTLSSLQQRDGLRGALASEDASKWPHFAPSLDSAILLDFANDVLEGSAHSQLTIAELSRREAAWDYPGLSELAEFVNRYRVARLREGIVDYGYAIELAARLLESSAEIANDYRRQFLAIFVAEFEDASAADTRLLGALADNRLKLTVAGDPQRAIASYRGGSADHLLALASDPRALVTEIDGRAPGHASVMGAISAAWPGRPSPTVPVPGIPKNGPSSEPTAIAQREQKPEPIQSGSLGSASLSSATITEFGTTADEARYIADQVSGLLRTGTPIAEIAIVCRTLGSAVPRLLSAELRRRGVPVDVADGRRALDEPLVQSLVYLLRYVLDPTPDVALRLLDSPLAELPRFGLPRLRSDASRAGVSLESVLEIGTDELDVAPDILSALVRLRTRVESLRSRPGGPNRAAVIAVFEAWTWFQAFQDDALGAGRGAAAVRTLLDELNQRRRVLGRDVTLSELIDLIDSGSLERLLVARPRRPGVTICTAHAAKGREWQVVYLPDMVEGVFPLRRERATLAPLLDYDLPLVPASEGGNVDSASTELLRLRRGREEAEERRIFYVAVSGARSALHFTYSRRGRDGKSAQSRSRYLETLGLPTTVNDRPNCDPLQVPDVNQLSLVLRRRVQSPIPMEGIQGAVGLKMISRVRPELVRPESWWPMISTTTGAAIPHANGRLSLSASRLGSYRDCPLAYQYGYEWRIGEAEGAALTTGSTLHTVLEEYHRPGSSLGRSEEALIECLDRVFKSEDYPYKPVARQERARLESLLRAYFARYGTDSDTLAVERDFSFKLASHDIRGFVDRIDRLPDQTLELIDYKSGGAMTHREAGEDLQLALYDLAFHRDSRLSTLGVPSLVSYLYLKELVDAGPRTTGKRSYTPTPDSRDALVAWTETAAHWILSERFPAYLDIVAGRVAWNPDDLDRLRSKNPCLFCAFTWICPAIERGGSETE